MVFNRIGAGNEIRTRGLDLGKVALYQLSYTRFNSDFSGIRCGRLPLSASEIECISLFDTPETGNSTVVASPRGVEPLLPG